MPPVIAIDHHAFERHADKGGDKHGADPVAAAVPDDLAQAKADRQQHEAR